jgi:hypothetical protein
MTNNVRLSVSEVPIVCWQAAVAGQLADHFVWAATLDRDGPTGGLFYDGRPVT